MHKYVIAILVTLLLSNCKSQNHTNSPIMNNHKYTNKLINESSPYLLQHAHNPVNWEAWHPAVLAKAKAENKLIIISIGYAACHWCHVMEHESFEDTTIAKLMNDNFICIKIDREERPDIDQVYMTAVQILTGRGGWPLNIVALPDGRPVWGGTYFTKNNWANALEQLAKMHITNPEQLEDYAEGLTNKVKQADLITVNKGKAIFTKDYLKKTVDKWANSFDKKNGGTVRTPKFPLPNNYEFLLRYAIQANDNDIMKMVNLTLTKMSQGGIYDQIGGGFSRYSTDGKWHIPHFEKMLYDNAQLVSLYSKAYTHDKNNVYKDVVIESLNFVERELMGSENNFYSSLDADSDDGSGHLEEGAYYVWTKDELKQLLGEDFKLFKEYYNVNNYGRWEHGYYVLIKNKTDDEFVDEYNIDLAKLKNKVASWKKLLYDYRSNRSKPRLDDKTLTSWNALMLKAYVEAYNAFGDNHFLEIALKNANFIIKKQMNPDSSLYHNYKNGKSTINAHLEDYALVIDAFISLYQATIEEKWLDLARSLSEYTILHFHDKQSNMFFFTSDQDPAMITRKIETYDGVIPSSNSVMAINLFKLSHYFENKTYKEIAEQMLKNTLRQASNYGSGFSNWLLLYSDFVGEFYEIAIIGEKALKYIKELNKKYLPNAIIAASKAESNLPLLKNRFINGKTLIYICIDGACLMPNENLQTSLKQVVPTWDQNY